MRAPRFLFFCILILAATLSDRSAHAANTLTNPGFEIDPPGETQITPTWTQFGTNTYSENNATQAHSGSNYFKVFQEFINQVNYSGIYQDNITGPGAVFTADGWAFTSSSDQLAGQNIAWLEVTFRDVAGNILTLYRSAIVTTNSVATGSFPPNTWNHLSIATQYDPVTFQPIGAVGSLTAPPGTSFVRYQILFQGDGQFSGGSMYFDDLNLTRISGAPYGDWNIVWSDEFNGLSINTNIWTYDTGNGAGGWGNGEAEYYTSRTNNSYVSNGLLHIVARQESTNGFFYTSARMKTQGLFSMKYGRIEFRAKLPQGVGFWPALWMLGTNIDSIGWPGCGEIDIMENAGGNLTNVQGSLHSGSDETAIYTLPGGSVTNFHTYTLEWASNAINWFVDGVLYETQTSWSSSVGPYPTPFNQPFFLLMNLAVGGSYIGYPSNSTINVGSTFPGDMQVDYVRIYNETSPLEMSMAASNSSGLVLTWPTNIVCHLQLQTNSAPSGVTTNWVDGTGIIPPYIVPLNGTHGSAYFRLSSP
jgi:beta-glucanase (GH16 family)